MYIETKRNFRNATDATVYTTHRKLITSSNDFVCFCFISHSLSLSVENKLLTVITYAGWQNKQSDIGRSMQRMNARQIGVHKWIRAKWCVQMYVCVCVYDQMWR